MNSFQIEKILAADEQFLGCFAVDMLPTFPNQYPRSMIINTDIASKPGDHWLGLVLGKDKCFYFDSFGVPILDKNIKSYLKKRYNSAYVSDKCIQDISSELCGKFTIAFVSYVRSVSQYKKFLSIFDEKNLQNNDEKILRLFEEC